MNVITLIESGVGINVTLTPEQLIEVIDYVVQKTKNEFEQELIKKNVETYMNSKELCKFLDIDDTTLWRWEKRSYITPIYVGGKKRYKRSEIEKRFTSTNN